MLWELKVNDDGAGCVKSVKHEGFLFGIFWEKTEVTYYEKHYKKV